MIKFFRKIRQKLIAQNKFRNYLLYALGEIVLVVLGILIALQLNTWRVEKNDRQIEKDLLISIKEDLKRDLRELGSVKDFKTAQDESCIRLLEYMIDSSKPLEDSVQFINDLQQIIYFIVPSANRTSYDLATSTGYLNHITNDSLVNELSAYYNDIALEQHVTDTKRFINAHTENNLMLNYRMFSRHVMALDGEDGVYALDRYRNDSRPILSVQDIRGDISLENYLNNLSIRLNIGIRRLAKEEKWTEGLIKKIELEFPNQ